jgi:HJR/Mrr/RecB family endonuclease
MKNNKNEIMFIGGVALAIISFVFLADDSETPYIINVICFFLFFIVGILLMFLSRSVFIENKIYSAKKEYEAMIKERKMIQDDITRLKNEKTQLSNSINELTSKNQALLNDKDRITAKINEFRSKIGKDNIEYVDEISGLEFEEYIKDLLERLGYKNVTKTPASGDFGVDVIAEKDNVKYAIQCKNYQGQLSNKCVQEAFSGKQHYNCHVGVVVTNSYFSHHAIEQAKSTGVLLWDRDKLISMINKLKK